MTEFKMWLVFSFVTFIILIDLYSWQAIKTLVRDKSVMVKKWAKLGYYSVTVIALGLFISLNAFVSLEKDVVFRYYLLAVIFVLYLPKLFMCIFLLIDDLQRLLRWTFRKANRAMKSDEEKANLPAENKISRAKFISQTATVAGVLPMILLTKGIVKGAYDYQIHRVPLFLKNLPFAFEGLKVLQVSDIHTGSLFDKDSVYRGIQMAMDLKPDIIFFTGDLVNNETSEAYILMDHFAHLKAPMGVYSIFGNHDYGDYISWTSKEAKQKNLDDLVKVHADLGWHLMRNSHVMLEKGGERIALVGVENWGDRGRFQKFGDIDIARKDMPDAPVQLLLSHDPSHFDAIVSKQAQYKNINATFSGHTHGFQFGIENSFIKWSPSQYIYPHWAGLYKEGEQQLYVNRGYGFLGYPGRVGILPEITLFELKRS